jgi:3-oxoacyl-[acyl-carrier protein] reductase
MFDLSGTTALVTGVGAKGGIGYSIAQHLLLQGASVHITSTTQRVHERADELIELLQEPSGTGAPRVSATMADLTDSDQVKELFFGLKKLDILVNNAGMTSAKAPLGDDETTDLTQISDESWALGTSRNLDTVFKVTRAALPLLRVSTRGRIIMVSSVTGPRMAMKHQPGYAAAKAAVVGLMRSLALDEARHQVTCNAILPGWIATDTQLADESRQGLGTPLGRSGTPAEIAATALWLASKESAYLTGQEIVVDGGNSIAEERS